MQTIGLAGSFQKWILVKGNCITGCGKLFPLMTAIQIDGERQKELEDTGDSEEVIPLDGCG